MSSPRLAAQSTLGLLLKLLQFGMISPQRPLVGYQDLDLIALIPALQYIAS